MDRESYIKYCLTLPCAVADNPFRPTPSLAKFLVLRNAQNRKWFALIAEQGGRVFVNLKCDPPYGDYLKAQGRDVHEAYHMNKRHWIAVYLDEAPDDLLEELTNLSYWLTAGKKKS